MQDSTVQYRSLDWDSQKYWYISNQQTDNHPVCCWLPSSASAGMRHSQYISITVNFKYIKMSYPPSPQLSLLFLSVEL